MQSISDFLVSLGPWNWLILAVVLFALETVAPGVYLIWFGVAAAIVGAIALSLDIAWQWQLVIFGAVALVSVVFFRQYARFSPGLSDQRELNDRASHYIGRIVEIEEAIVAGRGRARIADGLWSVEGPDTPAGEKVRIVGRKGTVLVVKALE